jgi:hypothetical protein
MPATAASSPRDNPGSTAPRIQVALVDMENDELKPWLLLLAAAVTR